MIVDTDTHAIPMEIFGDNFEPNNLVVRLQGMLDNQINLDAHWQGIYNQIKAVDWPECGAIVDFVNLPKRIRHELKYEHTLNSLIYISDDLQSLHVDHSSLAFPDIATSIKSAKLFCKVDRQIINPPARLFKMVLATESDLAVKLMHTWNSGMSKLCKENPELDFTLWLAMQDFEASMQELQNYADQDFLGVWLDERQPWAWQQDKFEFFEFCNDHRIPIYFHLVGIDDAPLSWKWDYTHPRYLTQSKKWPGAVFIASGERWQANIASFITEGVLDQFPDLRIIITEHGLNWIKPMKDFMLSQGWTDPMPYFKRNFWFTVELEEQNFFANADRLGWDRLLFATDYPHNDAGGECRYSDVDLLQSWLASSKISQKQYDFITHQNYQLLKSRK